MSQMNTFQVNTVYTERSCVYVSVRCNLKRNISWAKWTHCKLISIYWEKVCVCKSQVQLFEEEHAHPDLHATILRYEQPSCWTKQGKKVIWLQLKYETIERSTLWGSYMYYTYELCWYCTIFEYFRLFSHGLSRAITHNCPHLDVMSNNHTVWKV